MVILLPVLFLLRFELQMLWWQSRQYFSAYLLYSLFFISEMKSITRGNGHLLASSQCSRQISKHLRHGAAISDFYRFTRIGLNLFFLEFSLREWIQNDPIWMHTCWIKNEGDIFMSRLLSVFCCKKKLIFWPLFGHKFTYLRSILQFIKKINFRRLLWPSQVSLRFPSEIPFPDLRNPRRACFENQVR